MIFKGRVETAKRGGFEASIDGVRGLKAWGETRVSAEWNLKLLFAGFVARERREGKLCGELVVIWV